jgi:hypothetical protein
MARDPDTEREANNPTAEADLLRATERARLRALVAADLEAAGQFHADDYQLVTPGGDALSKPDYLGAVASGAIDYRVWEPDSPIEVRLYGHGAVIRYRSRIEIVVSGREISGRYWHTDSYEKRDGRWQVVWSQATEIRPR